MALKRLHVEGYRSLREIWFNLKPINVLVGPNGCGKSNLYRSLYLIASAANGQFAKDLAQEGGIPSVLWAGQRRKNEDARMLLEVTLDVLNYKLVCGRIPISELTEPLKCFENDPDIKLETVHYKQGASSAELVKRARGIITARDLDGKRIEYPMAITQSESILSGLREPHRFPELSALRQEFLNWRFYHQFRTDQNSPLRHPQIGVMTPVMAHDGSDVAAALATIQGMGEADLNKAMRDAFPGSQLIIDSTYGRFSISMTMPGFGRKFEASELSDGTLQYICLLAALLTPRPPSLMVFNEPENSIHPDLLEPLAKLIVRSSKKTQILLTTHSRELANYINRHSGIAPIELKKVEGETRVVGARLSEDDDEEDEEAVLAGSDQD